MFDDPTFYCAAGPGTLNPYAPVALYDSYFMHRSSSTQSFTPHHHQAYSADPDPTPAAFFQSSACDLTGDLQGMNCLPGSDESGIQAAVAAASARAVRYTAEERMKRVERYRSKRNQRNFHKKINYACRKTLADSRPRVRGRFARYGEPETETEASEITQGYNNNESCESYNNYDNGGNAGEWWRQMQSALATTDQEAASYDEDRWACFGSAFSMNLLS